MEKTSPQTKSKLNKIVFIGPESTGKTTLAKQLAYQHHTEWVPEYARIYLQKKYDQFGRSSTVEDILPIAKGQIKLEKQKEKKANAFLFYDTNIFQNYIYAKVYFPNHDFNTLKSWVFQKEYDYYFLTNIDIPWVKDDLRDKPKEREKMFQIFKDHLIKNKIKYFNLEGDLQTRLHTVNSILQPKYL